MNHIRSLIVKFDNEISARDIIKFRGAVVSSMENSNVLFHNHNEEGLRYSYPLIQYKRIRKKAAIVCFGEGVDVISDFFTQCNLQLRISDNVIELITDDIKAERTLIQLWENPIAYRLRNWLPLNKENYTTFVNTDGLIEKAQLLENILNGNILSAMKGLNISIQGKIQSVISEISTPKMVKYKGVKLMSFDISFTSNISLPQYLGLGKHSSVGFGILTKKSR